MNQPTELAAVLQKLDAIRQAYNDGQAGNKRVSLADVIVLAGCAAVEEAARKAGYAVEVPFAPGRTDATQEQTDVASFEFLRPTADGFRNYYRKDNRLAPAEMLVDKAGLLSLTVPEMTVLVGGMRSLNATPAGRNSECLPAVPER